MKVVHHMRSESECYRQAAVYSGGGAWLRVGCMRAVLAHAPPYPAFLHQVGQHDN